MSGDVRKVGVEGTTGSSGAEIARHLPDAGIEVLEVNRPDRVSRSPASCWSPPAATQPVHLAVVTRIRTTSAPAMAESFNSTLEFELLREHHFARFQGRRQNLVHLLGLD